MRFVVSLGVKNAHNSGYKLMMVEISAFFVFERVRSDKPEVGRPAWLCRKSRGVVVCVPLTTTLVYK